MKTNVSYSRNYLKGLCELRTKFRLGGTYRGLYRVLGGTYSGIYYKLRPELI